MRWCKSQPLVSILVPFRENNDPQRTKTWKWLEQFYSNSGYGFEIIVGTDDGLPFSKTSAVNNAASRAKGKVFVVMDADCYTDPEVIIRCAKVIVLAEKEGRQLWFVPYLKLYRLTEEATTTIINADPVTGYSIPSQIPSGWIEPGNTDQYGHKYGAMLLMMSAKAFWTVGGMDPRFRGWGSEDLSFMISLDTLYGLHETVDNPIYHMWHARPGANTIFRRWDGQRTLNINVRLGQRYGLAKGEPTFMKVLVEEHYRPRLWIRIWNWIKKLFKRIRG